MVAGDKYFDDARKMLKSCKSHCNLRQLARPYAIMSQSCESVTCPEPPPPPPPPPTRPPQRTDFIPHKYKDGVFTQLITAAQCAKHFFLLVLIFGVAFIVVDRATDRLIYGEVKKVKTCGLLDICPPRYKTKKSSTATPAPSTVPPCECLTEPPCVYPAPDPDMPTLSPCEVRQKKDEYVKEIESLKEKIRHLECWKQDADAKMKNINFNYPELVNQNAIEGKIEKAISKFESDKLGQFDYAAKYAGGEILDTPDTYPYPSSKSYSLFGLFTISFSSKPELLITPSTYPGDCFAFYGSTGRVVIKLGKKVPITSVGIEHAPKALVQDFSSAPNLFEVLGIEDCSDIQNSKKTSLGRFNYDIKGKGLQTFTIHSVLNKTYIFECVELVILSNHGNSEFTCVYRFRVHSTPPPTPNGTDKVPDS